MGIRRIGLGCEAVFFSLLILWLRSWAMTYTTQSAYRVVAKDRQPGHGNEDLDGWWLERSRT